MVNMHEKYSELLAGHVLGSLDTSETMELFTHLETCAECQGELPDLESVVSALAWAAEPIEPPPGLKGRVMAAIAHTPQEPLLGSGLSVPAGSPAASVPRDIEDLNRNVVLPLQRSRRVFQLTAAACLALLVGTVGWNGLVQETADPFQDQSVLASQVADMAGNPGTLHTQLVSSTGSVHGTAMVGDGQVAVMAQGLPPLEEGYQYVVWEESDKDGLHAVRGFNVDSDGEATVVTDLTFEDVQAVAISKEPAGNLPSRPSEAVVSGGVRF